MSRKGWESAEPRPGRVVFFVSRLDILSPRVAYDVESLPGDHSIAFGAPSLRSFCAPFFALFYSSFFLAPLRAAYLEDGAVPRSGAATLLCAHPWARISVGIVRGSSEVP